MKIHVNITKFVSVQRTPSVVYVKMGRILRYKEWDDDDVDKDEEESGMSVFISFISNKYILYICGILHLCLSTLLYQNHGEIDVSLYLILKDVS